MRAALVVLILARAAAFAAELTPEQKKAMVAEHYQRAFEFFKGEEYARAIRHWESILELDPAQKSAKQMIGEARKKIEGSIKEQERQVYKLVDEGKYGKAHEGLLKLLEADPTNPLYVALESRLGRVAAILPESAGADQASRVLRTGLSAWLGRPENLKLAYDGLRHARDLAPKNESIPKLVADFEDNHSDVAGSNRVTPGMTLIEYKRFLILSHIYDGKYPFAIDACHEVLSLEPNDVLTLKRMGSAYFAMGHKDRAKEIWARALKLAPQDTQLKGFLAKVDQVE